LIVDIRLIQHRTERCNILHASAISDGPWIMFSSLFKGAEEKLRQLDPNTLISLIDVTPENSSSSLSGATTSMFESFSLLTYFYVIRSWKHFVQLFIFLNLLFYLFPS
jgi:hypothetical protein